MERVTQTLVEQGSQQRIQDDSEGRTEDSEAGGAHTAYESQPLPQFNHSLNGEEAPDNPGPISKDLKEGV